MEKLGQTSRCRNEIGMQDGSKVDMKIMETLMYNRRVKELKRKWENSNSVTKKRLPSSESTKKTIRH